MTPSSRSKTSAPTTTSRRVRPRRDFEALTERRLRAGKMFENGSAQADVVRELGVSRETASQWHATWREHGVEGLRGAQRAGRLPRLTDEQLVKVERALAKGPTHNGFPTELWTLTRVATVIEKVTGSAIRRPRRGRSCAHASAGAVSVPRAGRSRPTRTPSSPGPGTVGPW